MTMLFGPTKNSSLRGQKLTSLSSRPAAPIASRRPKVRLLLHLIPHRILHAADRILDLSSRLFCGSFGLHLTIAGRFANCFFKRPLPDARYLRYDPYPWQTS
jgi:hypothetical protein